MNDNDKNLIIKYITRQASDDEIAMVRYLIQNSRQHEEFYIEYYETWQKALIYDIDSIDAEKAYQEFLTDSQPAIPPRRRLFTLPRLIAAASIIIACTVGGYFAVRNNAGGLQAEHTSSDIKVPKGATMKSVLPDGTKVWINAGSVLKFEGVFNKTSRTVYLDGEAYFDIAEGSLPFIVKTNKHTIRDIGTIFNVKAYSDDLEFETAVIEGEVSVEGKISGNSDRMETISVTKQQVLKLNYTPAADERKDEDASPASPVAKVQLVNAPQLEAYTGWTEDNLVFEGKTFQEISRIMERKYDVQIIIDDVKLRNYEYTGSFRNVEHVEKALQILKQTTDINYSKEGQRIRIWSDNKSGEDRL